MDEQRLAQIREHFTGWIPMDDLNNVRYAQDLLTEVERLRAEVDRLRSEIEEQAAHQIESAKDWEEDNPEAAGILRMEAQNLRNILTPQRQE